ncbi:MAG: TlpA family protein disulfide reductase [Blastocatellia bacterium]
MSSPKTQRFWTLTRIGLIGAAILLIAAVASALYSKVEPASVVITEPAPVSDPGAGRPMPAAPAPPAPAALANTVMDAKINLLDGKSKKLSDYSGKVLIVDLWATWCGPCRQEIPHLVEIAKSYKSKGVEVIGLTNENPMTDAEAVKEFSKAFKINYPVGWATPEVQIGIMRGRNGIPQTLIIGRDGKVVNHFVGFSPVISVPQMKAALDQAIAAS